MCNITYSRMLCFMLCSFVITTKTSNSFLLLLVIWIFSILVIPRVSILIAGRLISVPSVDEINSKKFAYNRELSDEFIGKLGEFKPTDPEKMMEELPNGMKKYKIFQVF